MRYPEWLKKKTPKVSNNLNIRKVLGDSSIHTVCESALCPNRGECFEKNTVTFMILGDVCTRSCRFCAVEKHNASSPGPLPRPNGEGRSTIDIDEPQKVAEAAEKLGLKHVVITSVTRDDLPDGGAAQFAKTILAVREKIPEAMIEVLTPDFNGELDSLEIVLNARPDVFNHNVETIARLYNEVRPQASFERSLKVLASPRRFANIAPIHHAVGVVPLPLLQGEGKKILVKTGFMVGLGETKEEVFALLNILKDTGVDIVTIGQYIAPSKDHYPVKEFIRPEVFEEYKKYGESIGIPQVFAGPFVRSSYRAGEVAAKCGTIK